MRELSQITGLSTAAVSYALRGQRVSAETQARVQAAAERIGFRSDPIARALRGGRTDLVGVVGGSLADHWHQQFVVSLQGALRRHGLRMMLADAAGDAQQELALARDLADRRVDGLIVLPIDPAADDWRAIAAATPTVSVNASLPAPAGSIRFDSAPGIALALDHLSGLGHRRIVVLGGGRHTTPRRAGLRRVRCEVSSERAQAAARRVLSGGDRPTAVFALADSIAYGVYAAAHDLGLAVPGDVSVVGFDDIPISRLLAPALTAVGWDTPYAAASAAGMLVSAIDGRTPGEVVIEPSLQVRSSTAAL
jgi:LacI family transcriptional regulator